MKQTKIYTILGFFMLIVMSTSLIFSTLHSHHHIEWNHPEDFATTSTCFTSDTTVCPISGYLFNADISSPISVSYNLPVIQLILNNQDLILSQDVESLVLGRAPPFAV